MFDGASRTFSISSQPLYSGPMSSNFQVIQSVIERSPQRGKVAEVFRKAGFKITHAKEVGDTGLIILFYLKPRKGLAQLLGSNLEIVALLAEFRDFDARSVDRVREEVETVSGRVRLSTEVAFVVTGDPNTQEEVRQLNKTYRNLHTQLVGFSTDDLDACRPHGAESFVRSLQLRFYSRDLYQPRGPVLSPVNFFGREEIISELTNELRSGSGHIGVFGLRKMGKTSLLYRLIDLLRGDAKVAHAHVDLQKIVAVNPSPEYLLWSLSERLLDENSFLRRIGGFRLFGQYSLFSDVEDPESVFEKFAHDASLLVQEAERIKFVLMFDEIELLAHNVGSSPWDGEEYVRFWRFLRGLDQENPNRFSFFVTGTNPSCIEANKVIVEDPRYGAVEPIDNPTYNYFSVKYLPPLSAQGKENGDCGKLLNQLGHRMGLEWDMEAVDLIARYVGGHPSLLRHYASMVHQELTPREEKKVVDQKLVRSLASDFIRARDSDFSQMTDVLREEYEDEHYLLKLAARGKVGEFREWAKASPKDVAHLRGYGLIEDHLAGVGFKIELLQTWFQQREEPSGTYSAGRLKPPGTKVGSYEILESIGHSGGFGQVYKAAEIRRGDDRNIVALKLLESGSFSSLQREVDALSDVDHEHVVKLLDHGETASGELYLAMEFLQGNTFREHSRRATRFPEEEVIEIAKQLLDALIALHPNQEKIKTLRNKGELTEKELQQLQEARHGRVHRDIKPENVVYVPGRGPVLIDFGISSRVSDRVRTRKATPGYLPPDGVPGKWTPDVDLYQLGLTLLQVSTGIRYQSDDSARESNIDDLRTMANEELTDPLRRVLIRMTADSESDRWETALEARRALR